MENPISPCFSLHKLRYVDYEISRRGSVSPGKNSFCNRFYERKREKGNGQNMTGVNIHSKPGQNGRVFP
jgi:hypothetical protein